MAPSSSKPKQARKGLRRPEEVDKYVDTFLSTTCNTSRRYILELLACPEHEDGSRMPEMRSGEIAKAIGLAAATTSEHLSQLVAVGLVTSRREGNVVYYQLRNHSLVLAFHDLLEALDHDYALKKEM
ncbi:hypothetical protein KDW_16140 [Dictyobacter vulcani]|uniref:HTH arsR-type domain-containing protein n=1 Tax=Dictyobacter vulcani TaxID=2607529 RepID=A0A5J4KK96_9CHLR|nr:ArsR family transcriptional regulator [Dictyobacter vulcani]GER87452.1 hypothetical protein KDW_16140 [Dictyobacter vulcani]